MYLGIQQSVSIRYEDRTTLYSYRKYQSNIFEGL